MDIVFKIITLPICGFIFLISNITQAGTIVQTGEDLFNNPNVIFYRSTPSVVGSSLVFDTRRSDRWEKLFQLPLIASGSIPFDNPPFTITLSLNITRLTSDYDPYFAISDGKQLVSATISDNQFTFNDRPGTSWLYDFYDAGEIVTQVPIRPKVIIADAGFPDIGGSFDVSMTFTLTQSLTRLVVAFLEGTGQPYRDSSLVLDRTSNLSLVMLGENIAEKYQINSITITTSEVIIPVIIDIKPGNDRNVINPRSKGGVWVAILSETDPNYPFDPPSQVDIPTVEFGPDGAKAIRHNVKDINKDGLGDLLLRFKIRETGIACGDTEATLTGETFDGASFTGTDSIKTVGCKPKKCHKKKHNSNHCDDKRHHDKHDKEKHDDDRDDDHKKR